MQFETTGQQKENEVLFKTWLEQMPNYKTDGNATDDAVVVIHLQRTENNGAPIARVQGLCTGNNASMAECLRQVGAGHTGVAAAIMHAADLIYMDMEAAGFEVSMASNLTHFNPPGNNEVQQ